LLLASGVLQKTTNGKKKEESKPGEASSERKKLTPPIFCEVQNGQVAIKHRLKRKKKKKKKKTPRAMKPISRRWEKGWGPKKGPAFGKRGNRSRHCGKGSDGNPPPFGLGEKKNSH